MRLQSIGNLLGLAFVAAAIIHSPDESVREKMNADAVELCVAVSSKRVGDYGTGKYWTVFDDCLKSQAFAPAKRRNYLPS